MGVHMLQSYESYINYVYAGLFCQDDQKTVTAKYNKFSLKILLNHFPWLIMRIYNFQDISNIENV